MSKAILAIITITIVFLKMTSGQTKEPVLYHHNPDLRQKELVKQLGQSGLSYGLYANEGEVEVINMLPDFSYAGYKGGGVAIPDLAATVTLEPKEGNNRERIQEAIDQVSSMPLNANGFRGKVLLKTGTYHIGGSLNITSAGVVLAGEGQGHDGTVLIATKRSRHTLINLGDDSADPSIQKQSVTPIISAYVPTGAIRFAVESTAAYHAGDTILIQKTPNKWWVRHLKMEKYGWDPESYYIGHERIVTAVEGQHITVNIPVVDPVKQVEGGGRIYRVVCNRQTKNSGIEKIRLVSEYDHEEDEEHAWYGIKLAMAENCWVREVTSQYFGSSAVTIDKASAFNTIEDCAMLEPMAKTKGRRKYSFFIQSGSFNLIQRCYTLGGRHDYVTGSKVSGPNVFLDSYAEGATSDIGPHLKWATGTLFDNIKGGNLRVRNRKSSGSGHGWAGAQTMLWNCVSTSAKGMTCESPPGYTNWMVGGQAQQFVGNGFKTLSRTEAAPRSLYLAQLKARLGDEAIKRVSSRKQRANTIYVEVSKLATGS
ncbi:hypothetical protein MKJ04_04625 [Pontibacter sp. E15-1]|uniref:hypothetical protein n=1 Tax=Pontibacter sp. E15-1 TaxID=2919918 RepID=UPI001F50282A|nr:hypothetical protein [Pontibacter sp. E15-1]MCJ8164115.1 hypothetical protein [Pontibacter sp. E15-1]